MHKYLLVALLVVALGGVYVFAGIKAQSMPTIEDQPRAGDAMPAPQGTTVPAAQTQTEKEVAPRPAARVCQDDVTAAQKGAEDMICTQVVALLRCPGDATFTYQATNGCEISFLEARGW